ncbi:hypothetical protein PHMEG_00010324 [Phytophthora megakarya]|uniref:Uncharacterized protein n=1 Tax=Phytophthora megakarya TaxID=4795 RepID=A0A225WFQ4_9STRA|nr:hypothetical protein PHMEG_00010324 [Phytophthora megakarya]
MYEIYTKELNENYARIDKVFEECGMDSMSIGSVNSRHQLNSNRSIEYIQHVSKQLQPFSFENMYKKLCKISKMIHRDIDRDIYEDNNTLALKFRLKHTLATGSTVSILSHKLSRQFHDNDRVVFMWKSFWEGEGVLSGMDADGTAWVSIRPYSDGSTSGTLMEVCARQVPAPLLTMNPNASAVKDFKDMMGRAFKEDERETFATLRS